MNKHTERFVEGAKKILEKAPASSDPKWIEYLTLSSQQLCGVCRAPLDVARFESNKGGARYIFVCGHSHVVISLEETIGLSEGFKAASLGVGEAVGQQKTQARIGGESLTKEGEELARTKIFAFYFRKELTKFYNDKQDSPIDVIAESENGAVKESFQVTKLYNEEFWKELNTKNAANLITDRVIVLIKDAIDRKKNLDSKQREKIILLIDTWPGILPEFAERGKEILEKLLNDANFKEVWLIGSLKEQMFKIWPQ